ncbi:E3 ubiquitin-protein ligase isoform X1 [Capsicum annuum]|uniref:E3 ubiquitin-protein ligase At3g02290 isoform X1 n=1 Tax=Capsicum annuum TaxID=4072 RepID=UPI001FB18952|nr:E3 ubiquitin-protein ligase At3g02290 isoform X1 [Capsicum annuum]XP_016548325.2 E3 ubiquitin-protein ligase At3g02290 isoform X1 [Capsicum annuum]
MGSVCCCFHVSDDGGHSASNGQNHILCKCFSCCFQNLISKCGAIFGPAQQTAGTSANQVPSSSTSLASINSSHNTISSQDRGLPSIAAPRQPQIQEDVAFRRQDKGTSHTRVEPEPDIDADAEITQRLLKADKLPKSLFVNQEPSSSTAVVSINSSCNTIKPQDGGLPNSAAPRQPQMQQYKGTSHPQVEPELDIDADVEITQKLLKADKLLQSDSDNQGMTSSTAVSAIDTSCNTIISQDTGLPNSAAPREPQMQQDVALRQPDKTTSNSQVVPKPDADAEITEKLLREDKLLKSNCDGGSKECFPESPRKEYSSTMVTGAQYEVSSSEDEDVCPTCLEEYTPENPKISTKCSHHFHLSCIYEWQMRSATCPVCGKLMEFEQSN